jgi:hypothetical protein
MAEAHAAVAGPLGVPVTTPALSPTLQHVLCILLVAAAVKAPLGIPLYLNALLLAVGLFTIVVVQSLQAVFLWPLAMLALGASWAAATGTLPSSGPRLGQVALIVFATSMVARLDPALFARYLVLLLPLCVVVVLVEPLLPDPLYPPRTILGYQIPRLGGLHGAHNYNAVMLGAVGVILAQHRPRILALLPMMAALTAVSRGFLVALMAWLGAKAMGRALIWIAPLIVLVLCAQPFLVLGVDAVIDQTTRVDLRKVTSSRYPIWVAYAKMGLSTPLGAGYWQGPAAMAHFDAFFAPGQQAREPHSLYLQVFGEFGWLGYLLLVGFLLHVTWLALRRAPAQLPVLVFVLIAYSSYSGLSDWAFWVPIGYVLACVREAVERPAPWHEMRE